MSWESLKTYVDTLYERGELIRIKEEVATELEITAIADREMKKPQGGQALLFEKPTINGRVADFPLAINIFGSWSRMKLVFGDRNIDEIAAELSTLLKAHHPLTLKELGFLFQQALKFKNVRIKEAKTGPCKDHIYKISPTPPRTTSWPPAPRWPEDPLELEKSIESSINKIYPTILNMPILKCWPLDGGRYITLPCVVTKDPYTGQRNVGMYRMQIYDSQTTGMHWQLHKTGRKHFELYRKLRKKMPVTVFLGGDPIYTFIAAAPIPEGIDELMVAGYLRGEPVTLVKCETNDLEVPADADIIIEGYVDPEEPWREEGPFGDHTGFYTVPEPYPVFHITAVTWREGAIYPATIVGVPPMEDYYLGTAAVRLFLPMLKLIFPEIVDIAFPPEGVFHNFVFVAIRKTYPMQAYKIMHGLWGLGQMMFSKYIIVVDEDVNVHDTKEVLFFVGAHTDPKRDCLLSWGPIDVLDHASIGLGYGGKLGIDATKKLPGEGARLPWPPKVQMSRGVLEKILTLLSKIETNY